MRRRRDTGWTLIEIMVVLSIIVILVGITLGVSTGVRQRAAVGKAKAELAVLSTALEVYKSQYGDYPWIPDPLPIGLTTNEQVLFNALTGKLGPKGKVLKTAGSEVSGRSFVDLSRLNVSSTAATALPVATGGVVANEFWDPWGQPYGYFYRNTGDEETWLTKGFLLYSSGPDGGTVLPGSPNNADETGILTVGFRTATGTVAGKPATNQDNLYGGEY